MAPMTPQPDCCQDPTLETIRVVDELVAGQIVLQRCDACGTYWLAVHGCLELPHGVDIELEALERATADEVREALAEYAY
jgi:hypothetical protein